MSPDPRPVEAAAKPAGSLLLLMMLAALAALGPMATHTFVPALPAVQRALSADPAAVQLTLSLAMVAMAVATLFYGPLSDRIGRRPVLLLGIGLCVVGSLICAFAEGIGVMIFGRILQSAGGAVGIVIGRAVVRDVFPHEQVAAALARMVQAMIIAPLLAPVIGAWLVDLGSWRMIFWVVALFAMMLVPGVLFRLRETGGGGSAALGDLRPLFHSRTFLTYTVQSSFSMAGFYVFVATAPFVVSHVTGGGATDYGIWFVVLSLAFVGGSWMIGRIGHRFGVARLVRWGCIIALSGAVLSAAAALGGLWVQWALFAPITLMAFGNGMSMPSAQAAAMAEHGHLAGTASGVIGFVQLTVSALAAQVAGSLQGETPYPMVTLMVITASTALGCLSFARR